MAEAGEFQPWWEGFPRSWRDVALAVALLAAFVAFSFSPAATCSMSVKSTPTTTTTEAPDLGSFKADQ